MLVRHGLKVPFFLKVYGMEKAYGHGKNVGVDVGGADMDDRRF
jgi:hypothetical protein